MSKGRLEAFSDGVIAIIITIMVLELKVPHGADLESLTQLLPVFLSYVLSFVFLGIYWTNHHHMLHAAKQVDGRVLWANLYLLFWLSLVPFVTGWLGDNHSAPLPTAVYGVVMFLAGNAFSFLMRSIMRADGPSSQLGRAVGANRKGTISHALYLVSIPLAFVRPWISQLIFIVVAVMWFIPDPRIEQMLKRGEVAEG